MGEPTVLIYGSLEHPSLELIAERLLERGRCRVAFAVQERFPRETAFALPVGPGAGGGCLQVGPAGETIELDDVVSVCLDGYYVAAEALQDLDASDVEYVQTESWAALIAFFAKLSTRCLVANHVARRDFAASRGAELAWLAGAGFDVPRALVTSDPDAAREFYGRLEGGVIYRPVGGRGTPFKKMAEADLDRLDAIRLAPVHFEEAPAGEARRCVVVGPRAFPLPDADPPPADVLQRCLRACRSVGLRLAEVQLRRSAGGWLAGGLRTFVGADALEDADIGDAAADMLERGLEAAP